MVPFNGGNLGTFAVVGGAIAVIAEGTVDPGVVLNQ